MISIIMVKLYSVCLIKNTQNLNKLVPNWRILTNYINFTPQYLILLMNGEICFGQILMWTWSVIGWITLKNSRNNVSLCQKILNPGKLTQFLNNKLKTTKKFYQLFSNSKNHQSKKDIGKLSLTSLKMISHILKKKTSLWIIYLKLQSFQTKKKLKM